MLKNKEIVRYAFFGVCTTLVNIIVFYCFSKMLSVDYMVSNLVAWVASVSFAFITNKIYVFNSREWKPDICLKEAGSFFAARIATGIIDMVCMYGMVTILSINKTISKIVVNVIVIVLNYVFSKVWVFKKHKNSMGDRECSQTKRY